MQLNVVNSAFTGGASAKNFAEALAAESGYADAKSNAIDRLLSIAREQQLEREALTT